MKKLLLFVFSISFFQIGFAQQKGQFLKKAAQTRTAEETKISSKRSIRNLPTSTRGLQAKESKFQLKQLQPKSSNGLSVKLSDIDGRPISISGKIDNSSLKTNDLEVISNHYLENAGSLLQIENPSEEFQLKDKKIDDLQITHLKYQQVYQGLPVFGAEIILHEKDGAIYLLNGRSFSTPKIDDVQPQLTDIQSVELVKTHLATEKNLEFVDGLTEKEIGGEQVKSELVIYFSEGQNTNAKLVYHISIHPNRVKRFEYFVDANSGEIIDHHSSFCQFSHYELKGNHTCNHNHHDDNDYEIPLTFETTETSAIDGPTVATAQDLNGVNRTIGTYQVGVNYFMIDASKDMHREALSTFPNNGVGVIWTIDGKGGTPARQSSFNPVHVTSQNNAWTDRRAVSAHYNGEEAYDYFRTVHNRNSVNNQGGNIMSFFNIAEDDGSDMDNAFWNGAHIYYGNGAQAFTSSLAKSLDVAGHEMSHGVVQTTANLRYQGESGALNESFADIFAAMIDREDWKIGEDVVNTQIFRTGAMRDLSNPNNGGNSLNDEGYQPDHYNTRYTGSQDNGGVHINSGIPNHAFYLFATAVGKEKAEKVFYRALDNYLVASSQFIDLRAGAAQAAADLYGATEANAVHAAMDHVGIPGGAPNDYQDDLNENPGTDFCMLTDESAGAIYLATADGNLVGNPYVDFAIMSKPSITDDGTFAYFVGSDAHIYEIDLIENTLEGISDSPIWRNVAISKDGNRIAALSDENDNGLYIVEFLNGANKKYELFNPTFTQGISTGEVIAADVIEWDYSGEWVMYDALNEVDGDFGKIDYWDIGFINVWNTDLNTFRTEGEISKLYSLVPENVSVGNPTFSKLSPYIIAFDFHEEGTSEYELLSANLQTGDVSDPPLFINGSWNVPNFTPDDRQISFDGALNDGTKVLALRTLNADKLSTSGDASLFLQGGRAGVWYANGVRDISSTESIDYQSVVNVYPNPTDGEITIEIEEDLGNQLTAQFFDLLGKPFSTQKLNQGKNQINLDFLSDGTYFVSIKSDGQIIRTERLMILR